MSSKRNRDGGKKPSVFERLGSKPSSSSTTEDYCKQWAHKGTCSYGSKCKFINTHNSKNKASGGKESRKEKRSRSRSQQRKDNSSKHKATIKTKNGKPQDADSGDWEKSLEHEDEMALERKLQMLQRELAKEEQEHKRKGKKTPVKKRGRSSSSSSTSSSSSSDSSSDSSDSSSSSSGSTSSSSSSSSDSDGEVKDKKPTKKKPGRGTKRSHSSSSRNPGNKGKSKGRPKKTAKLSPSAELLRKKDPSNKKPLRGSQPHSAVSNHHANNSNSKHQRESPTFSPPLRSRSPRLKESEITKERRLRRTPETNDTKRKSAAPLPRGELRRREDPSSPGRGRDRKSANMYDPRSKVEKPRDRLLEPNYMIRPRSPSYREPYPIRDCSPASSSFRERTLRAEPYDSRRGYSPPLSKLERKDDPYDPHRSRRPISPEPLRRPITRTKEYRDYERDWPVSEPAKLLDWDHAEYRRNRSRPLDDVNWSRNAIAADPLWKKSYSPPPPLPMHSYSDIHSTRGTSGWDSALQPLLPLTARPSEHQRERDRRESHRSRESRRNQEPIHSTKPVVENIAPVEEPHSPAPNLESVPSKPVSNHSDAEVEEPRPASAAVDIDESVENFSDFSDDVDEILNRDLQVQYNVQEAKSEKVEEALENEPEPLQPPSEPDKVSVDLVPSLTLSPRNVSPLPSVADSRADEDLLGGMDIEQVSDEELLEEESKTVAVDALDVDWASLACKREKKVESGRISARQRWQGKEILARLSIFPTGQRKPVERKPLFDTSGLFRRALSARMELSLRRTLCGLPARELLIEHCDDDVNLYKASVELLLREQVAAN